MPKGRTKRINVDKGRLTAEREIAAVNQALREGYSARPTPGRRVDMGAIRMAAKRLGIHRLSFKERVGTPTYMGTWERRYKLKPDWSIVPETPPVHVENERMEPYRLLHETPPIGTSSATRWTLESRKDNTFRFAAFGDLHAGSKYCRYEVRQELTTRAEDFDVQCIFDTGNWIDGEKSFNRYDLEVVGLESQCQMLAERYPKTELRTYAVAGADHEGWYAKSEGIDVGRYCESVMREAGHPWTNLGYMQADVLLVNANTKTCSTLRVMHPGGGSAYALSYRPQKIIESMEGGEKPAVLLMGHYHKLDAGLIRNVWYAQTGTCQDQTPFMAQKAIEAHVGGLLVEIEQDPQSGAIIACTPQLRRYFNRRYYFQEGHGNRRWSGSGPVKPVPRQEGMA